MAPIALLVTSADLEPISPRCVELGKAPPSQNVVLVRNHANYFSPAWVILSRHARSAPLRRRTVSSMFKRPYSQQ